MTSRPPKVGDVVYAAGLFLDEDNKPVVYQDEWVVRTIRRRARKRFGRLMGDPLEPVTCYLVGKSPSTWGKVSKRRGDYGWKPSISWWDRSSMLVEEFPGAYERTKLAALRRALRFAEAHLKANAGPGGRYTEEELAAWQRGLTQLRGLITKAKKC